MPDLPDASRRPIEARLDALQAGLEGRLAAQQAQAEGRLAALQAQTEGRLATLQAQTEGRLAALQAQVAALAQEVQALRHGQAIYLGDHEALTRLYTGHRIYVDTRDVGICSHLMLEGRWEPWIEAVLREELKPGMRFADLGANFGYYTLLGAQWVGAEGRVFAFEANPTICRKLRKSVSINGFDDRVRIWEVGVWSGEGTLEFAFTHEYSGGGGVGAAGEDPVWAAQRVRVPVAPLDRLLADVPSLDVAKIDVEGAEPAALAGAAALLARSPRITLLVEFQEAGVAAQGGGSALAYLGGLARQGFALSLIEPAGRTPPLSPEACLAQLGGRLGYLHLRRG
jgi:FkbM family methyltransferase